MRKRVMIKLNGPQTMVSDEACKALNTTPEKLIKYVYLNWLNTSLKQGLEALEKEKKEEAEHVEGI